MNHCMKPQARTMLLVSAKTSKTKVCFSSWLLMNAVLRRRCRIKSFRVKQPNNEASFRHRVSEPVSVNRVVDSQ